MIQLSLVEYQEIRRAEEEDGIEQAAKAGVKAIVQPGGSTRDKEVIAAADKLGIAMAFTGIRHFKH